MSSILDGFINANNPPAQTINPLIMGLLGAAAGAGQYSGASRLPISNGQVIGGAAGGFGQGYLRGQQALAEAATNQARGMQNQLLGEQLGFYKNLYGQLPGILDRLTGGGGMPAPGVQPQTVPMAFKNGGDVGAPSVPTAQQSAGLGATLSAGAASDGGGALAPSSAATSSTNPQAAISNAENLVELGGFIPMLKGFGDAAKLGLQYNPAVTEMTARAKKAGADPIAYNLSMANQYGFNTPLGNDYYTAALQQGGVIPARQAQERIQQNAQRIALQANQQGVSLTPVGMPGTASVPARGGGAGAPPPAPRAAAPNAPTAPTSNFGIGAPGTQSLDPNSPRVQAIAHYQVPPGSQWGANTPYSTALLNAVLKVNPNYDATQFVARNKAVTDFATGPEGNAVRSFNVAVQHLGVLSDAAKALDNGKLKPFNSAHQFIWEQMGVAAPENFDAIKQIVGQEITKAIIAGGGGVTERQAAAETVERANSPEQLAGVITQYQNLMAGQLNGLRQQYKSSTMLNDFDSKLLPSTRAAMFAHGYGSHSATGPGGRKIYSEDGRTWYNADGTPFSK